MNKLNHETEVYSAFDALCQDSAIRERSYYPDFRKTWERVLKKALHSSVEYFSATSDSVYTVVHSYSGFSLALHFDQLKLADWYEKELARHSKNIFIPKKLKRSRSGVLSLQDSICRYEPDALEPTLHDSMKNIIACALPGLPPELCIVYGNKWVDSKFTVLRQRSLSLFLLNTDYVPAFLATPEEVALYLLLMDCCIIKENYQKVKDEDLRQFLHIFKPSPMLGIKGLL